MKSIDQKQMKKLMVEKRMPGLEWWKRKCDKFFNPGHSEELNLIQNGLLDGPEARFFAVFVHLYDTGGIYVDLTTMMLGPLPEVYVRNCVTCHYLIER